jgi:hypothetical protein
LDATVGKKIGRADENFCKFGTEQKSMGWNVTHTKMQEQTGLNCANEQREN